MPYSQAARIKQMFSFVLSFFLGHKSNYFSFSQLSARLSKIHGCHLSNVKDYLRE